MARTTPLPTDRQPPQAASCADRPQQTSITPFPTHRPYIDPRRIARAELNDDWLAEIDQRLHEVRHVEIVRERRVTPAMWFTFWLAMFTLALGCIAVILP